MLGSRRNLVQIGLIAVVLSGAALALWLMWRDSGGEMDAGDGQNASSWLATGEAPTRVLLLARNTTIVAGSVCAIGLPLGTALALLLVRTDVPGRRAAMLLLGLMLFMPLYLQAAAWESGFGRLGWFTAVGQPWLRGWTAVVWIHALAAAPWTALIVGLGLRFVEPELEEEALIDGSAGQVFLRVTLPRAIAAMTIAALWIVVTVAGEMTVTDIYQVRTYAEELYTGFALGDTLQQAWGAALPGMALIGWLTIAALVAAAAVAPPGSAAPTRPPWTFRLGAWRWVGAAVVVVVLLLIVGAPLFSLCVKAGFVSERIDDSWRRSWSPAQFVAVLDESPQEFKRELSGSLLVGAVTACAALSIAAMLAWYALRGGWYAAPALLTAAICLALPGPLIGLGVNWLLSLDTPLTPPWLYSRTIFAPVLALTIRTLPLTILVCWFALRSVSGDVLEAAAAEGAGGWSRFFSIAAPQRAPALAAAWLAAFALAMGDLTASVRAVPPGYDLISIRIFDLVHFGVRSKLAGLCLTSVFIFTVVGFLAMALLSISLRSTSHKQR